jgi:uncharacterized protein YacL
VSEVADTKDATARWRYGLIAVLGGLVAIVVVLLVAVWRFNQAGDVNSVLGSVITAISTLVAAYFGVQIGSAGKEEADRARNTAHEQALSLAAAAEPATAVKIVGEPSGPLAKPAQVAP